MHNLVYKSIANTLLAPAQIDEMLEHARVFNENNDITGCLLYHRGIFVQYLEGELEGVLALFERIKVDMRHSSVDLLSSSNIYTREFDTWSMAYLEGNIPNEAYEYIEFMVNPVMEIPDMSVIPNPTSKRFWLAAKKLLHKMG